LGRERGSAAGLDGSGGERFDRLDHVRRGESRGGGIEQAAMNADVLTVAQAVHQATSGERYAAAVDIRGIDRGVAQAGTLVGLLDFAAQTGVVGGVAVATPRQLD
jgi:hypothetical protein